MIKTLAAAVTVMLGGAVAYAQPGPDGDSTPSEPAAPPEPAQPPAAPAPVMVAPPAPAVSHVDRGVLEDASSGRGWLMPTALTDPGGTWSFSDFELLLIGVGYSPTDQLSLSFTTLVPVGSGVPFWGLLNAKLQIIKAGNVRVAIQGAVTVVTNSNSDGEASNSFTAGDLGAALTLCVDSDCRSTISGFIGGGFADSSQTSVPFVVAGSFAARLGRHVKFVGEVDSAFIAGKINQTANGALLWYGLRFTSPSIGVDVGFAKPVGDVSTDGSFPIGFPFVSFSYRNID